MKFKNISVQIDDTVHEKNKKVWLDISKNLLFYLSWNDGRIYFFFNKDHPAIQNITINRETNIMEFDYKGMWQDFQTNLENYSEKHFSIKFHDDYDLVKLVSLVNI